MYTPIPQPHGGPGQPKHSWIIRHIFAEILGVLLFVVIVNLIFLGQSSTPDTDIILPIHHSSAWKTYSNDQYGFEFQYPQSYEIDNTVNSDAKDLFHVFALNSQQKKESAKCQCGEVQSVTVSIVNNPTNLSVDDWLQKNYQTFLGTSSKYSDFQTNMFEMINGYEGRFIGSESGLDYLLSKNRFIYIVSFIDANRNIADTFKFTDTSVVYENDYLKLTIPAGWKATEAPQTNYQGNCGSGKTDCTIVPTLVPNPGAVNITKGNYILYINTQAGHASGVEGGRFSEIAYGAPSVTATLKDISSGVTCGIVDEHLVTLPEYRFDYYNDGTNTVEASRNNEFCNVPTSQATTWYFSYINERQHGYFMEYNDPAHIPLGLVITMAYNSQDINKLPIKGSLELNTALDEMTQIAKSLVVKQK